MVDYSLPRPINRRGFLRMLAAAGGVGTLGILSACDVLNRAPLPARPSATPAPSAGLTLPAYVPVTGPKPDLPGTADIEAGYFSFPKEFFKSVKQAPGRGNDVTIMTWTTGGPVVPFEENSHWQAINNAMGANIKLVFVSNADYRPKFASTLAGGDLPDSMYVPRNTPVVQLPTFLKSACADLTPFLGGDGIKEYPNLANIPTDAWRSVVFNRAIFGVPVTFSPVGSVHWVHQELVDGISATLPRTADEYKRLLVELTRPEVGQYGLASYSGQAYGANNEVFSAMFGAPNVWAADASGKLTSQFETEQFKAAVAYVKDLVTAGTYHPNSPTYSVPAIRTDFSARRHVFGLHGWSAASVQFWEAGLKLNPPTKLRIVPPFAHDGGQARYFTGPASFGFSILKNGSPDRIREMLRLMDYFAAPFGSEEHLLLHYGVKDVHFTLDDNGNPNLTQKGQTELSTVWNYIAAPPPVLYNPNSPREYATMMQTGEKAMLSVGVDDPALYLYSEMAASQAVLLTQKVLEGLNEIVANRQPLSSLDQLVRDWRTNGGDQMRREYEQALQNAPA
jgi:putative aldouronate transport system substrate-binding protein